MTHWREQRIPDRKVIEAMAIWFACGLVIGFMIGYAGAL